MYANRTLDAIWAFNLKDAKKTTYAYPKPAPNDPHEPPQPEPNTTWPAGVIVFLIIIH